MLSQYIIAIAMWCGQPQIFEINGHGIAAKNDMSSKAECQKRLLSCVSFALYQDKNKNIKKEEKTVICFK